MSDELVFSDDHPEIAVRHSLPPWQVLIVDDDTAVHEVTRLVMSDFVMDGRPLQFTHCYSAAEARTTLAARNDIALILLDVVMESDQAGLDLVRHIRNELQNLQVRIVLRTGQPGQAPEEQVIRDYDINDYKEKTDLTRRKLITVFYAGLRAYRDLMRIEHARLGLRRSIEAICEVSESRSLRSFASAVLDQVNYLLDLRGEGLCASCTTAYTANAHGGHIKVLAATQAYAGLLMDEQVGNLSAVVREAFDRALREKASFHGANCYVGYYRTKAGSESIIYMEFPQPISEQAKELLEILSHNIAITYDGLLLQEAIHTAQRNTISILGGAIETRSQQPSPHWQHVGDIAALLGQKCGFDEHEVAMLRLAASLHDVGKACIDGKILTKPGTLTQEEWQAVRQHSQAGHDLLANSSCEMHTLAATIAQDHHERWDGTGYPQGLAGENISLAGRIVAIADVVDSLVTANSYRPARTLDEALQYVESQRGAHFDPAIAALLPPLQSAIQAIYHDNGPHLFSNSM
jgi:response regulator RpfG family c-di-GMP phosphodiesterase